jgi:hypothetical protein
MSEELRGLSRMTKRIGTQRLLDIDGELWNIGEANAIAHSMFDRLAAYEDTGLTPEQIARLQSELAEARERLSAAEGVG